MVQEAGWAPGPVWTGAENLAPTGIQSPYLPSRSQSLYRLSYPAPRTGEFKGLKISSQKFLFNRRGATRSRLTRVKLPVTFDLATIPRVSFSCSWFRATFYTRVTRVQISNKTKQRSTRYTRTYLRF
jgi:hypothetical protein